MTPERCAFDLSLYIPPSRPLGDGFSEVKRRMVDDLSALVIEAAPRARVEEAVTPVVWQESPRGVVVWPEFSSQPIEDHLRWETEADILESEVTLKIKEMILSSRVPRLAVWINPPDKELGYPQGRMVVGLIENGDGLRMMDSYTIRLDFEPEECLDLARSLFSLSDKAEMVLSIDRVRATPIAIDIPEGVLPLDFLAQLMPQLSRIWQAIRTGRVKEQRKRARRDASVVFREVIEPNIGWMTNSRVVLGAMAELEMIRRGWSIDSFSSGCGWLNLDRLSTISPFVHTHWHLNSAGEIVSTATEVGVFCRNCPYCGKTINKVIRPGFKCPGCGEVYLGTC